MAQESLKNIHETRGKKATHTVKLEKDDVIKYARQTIKNNKKVFDQLADL